jgi:HK97 family phage major capsid protein
MKNSIEIRQERAELIGKADALLNLAKGESRDFTNDEQTSYDGMMENIDKLAKDIEVVERQEKLNAEAASIPVSHGTQDISESKELRSFSFVDAFNAAKTGRVEGLVKEMDQEARMENPNQEFKGVAIPFSALESRAVNTFITPNASPSEVKSFVDDLYAASVLIPSGANFYTGVSASQKIPLVSGVQANFIAEASVTAAAEAGTIGGVELTPNTIIAATNVSNAAMHQNASIEAALRRNFASAIMSKFEFNLLHTADQTNGPGSIFADAIATGVTQTWTSSLALARIAEMQGKLVSLDNDITKPSFKLFMNGDAYNDLIAEVSGKEGSGFLASTMNLQDKSVLNMPYHVSNNVGTDTNSGTRARALMIDVSRVHAAMFGGLDMLVDPYSQSLFGGTRLVLSTLLDGALVQSTGKEVGVKCVAAA